MRDLIDSIYSIDAKRGHSSDDDDSDATIDDSDLAADAFSSKEAEDTARESFERARALMFDIVRLIGSKSELIAATHFVAVKILHGELPFGQMDSVKLVDKQELYVRLIPPFAVDAQYTRFGTLPQVTASFEFLEGQPLDDPSLSVAEPWPLAVEFSLKSPPFPQTAVRNGPLVANNNIVKADIARFKSSWEDIRSTKDSYMPVHFSEEEEAEELGLAWFPVVERLASSNGSDDDDDDAGDGSREPARRSFVFVHARDKTVD